MKNEELQQLVLESLGGCSWEYDLPDDIITYSAEFFQLLGYLSNEFAIDSDWVADNIHPEDLSQWRDAFVGSIKGSSRYFDCELRFKHKDGHYVWIQTRGVVNERDDQGRALRIVGMVFDISERKAAKETESRYRQFLDNIPDALSLKDRDGRYVYVNREFEKWLGKPSYQIYGRTAAEVFPSASDNLARLLDHELQVWERAETISVERQFPMTEDGVIRNAVITKFPVFDASGHILAIGSTSTDVTERYRTQQALIASERRYRGLFDGAPVILIETDWSVAKALVDRLRRQDVEDIRQHLLDHPALVRQSNDVMKILAINKAALRVFNIENDEELRKFLELDLNETQQLALIDDIAAFAAGNRRTTVRAWTPRQNGGMFPIVRESEMQSHDSDDWSQVLVTIRDDSAAEAVRINERRYRRLFESAPAVLCETDWSKGKEMIDSLRQLGIGDIRQHLIEHPELMRRQGQAMKVLAVNHEAVEIYRAEDEQAVIEHAEGELNEFQRLALIEELSNLASGQRRSTMHSSNWRLDGEVFPVIRVVEVYSDDPEDWSQVLLTVRDISAEESVRMSEMRYRRLFESAPVALYETDWSKGKALVDDLRDRGVEDITAYLTEHDELLHRRDEVSRVINLNREALEVYQAQSREQLISVIEGPLSSEQRKLLVKSLETFASGHRRSSIRGYSIKANGEIFPMVRSSELISSDRGDWSRVLTSIHDLTAEMETADQLRAYQEELRSLAGKISAAEESERRRISSELHDGTIQNLVLARIHLANLRTTLDTDKGAKLADSINDLLEISLRETRSLIFEISPPVLYELGLEPAVEWLAEHYKQRTGVEVRITSDKRSTRLAEEMNIVVFQTMRELLVNIAKHARAQRVSIEWRHNKTSVVLTLRDDGVGFDTDSPGVGLASEGGFGLFAVRERLKLLGADIDIESSDEGTCVIITAPVDDGQMIDQPHR